MIKEIYFAGGCFWGIERYFSLMQGVQQTIVGYANGKTENPTYQEVCREGTDHVETVKVVYDSTIVELTDLLEMLYKVIDPTSINRQGADVGRQYRSGVYFTAKEDQAIIMNSIEQLQKEYTDPIVIEVEPLYQFYLAEDYHQKYLDKNPTGYCHINLAQMQEAKNKRFTKYKKKSKAELKEQLTKIQYQVTQENATEKPFVNAFDEHFEEGIYVDITTGQPLFISDNKFNSGCGWPSFSKPIDQKLLKEVKDTSHGSIRTEVRSALGDAHLGHVFEDGPIELGGLRYCINSAALTFIAKDSMEGKGYAEYLPLFKKI